MIENPREMMAELLREIDRELPSVIWKPTEDAGLIGGQHQVQAYEGKTESGWVFLAISFEIESQGHPKGSRGYDGVGRVGQTVIRFTRALAERAFKIAQAKISTMPAPPDSEAP